MNFNDIINELADNPQGLEQKADRRDMLKGWGAKLAAVAIPFAATTTISTESKAQSKETINNVLNYLLKNEIMVEKFFGDALATPNLIPYQFKMQFDKMMALNRQHMDILKQLLDELGGVPAPVDMSKLDYSGGRGSGGGQFRDAYVDVRVFLLLMQVLTEAIVRIYKGQIALVLSDKIVVRNLSCIHSVKVRHSTFIRFMRKFWLRDEVKPWITASNSDSDNPAVAISYIGEANTVQAGMEIIRINGYDINSDAASQAFDEALDTVESENLMKRFVKPI